MGLLGLLTGAAAIAELSDKRLTKRVGRGLKKLHVGGTTRRRRRRATRRRSRSRRR